MARSTGNLLLSLALVLAAAVPTATAEVLVYFWHDSQGMIHFSAQRPTEGQIYAVHMPSYEAKDAPLPATPLTYEALFAAADASNQQASEQALAAKALAELKQQCDKARYNRDLLSQKPRIQQQQPDGSRRDMTLEEKEAEIARLDARIKDSCR